MLCGAQLERIDVSSTQLGNLDLERAKLVSCRFVGCNAYGIKLKGAVVIKCSFASAQPNMPAELTRANLASAALIDCDFRGANLYRADLRGALLVRCNLSTASLTGALVDGVHFIGCDLSGADLPEGLVR
jgi:uncharacterized protein YjbI with pentapeptide repeats